MKDSVTIGIDVGGSNIAIALIQAGDYDNAHYTSIPYVYKSSAYELSSYIYEAVLKLALENSVSEEQITKIGLAFPGSIDSKKGVVNYAHNLKLYDADIKGAFNTLAPRTDIGLMNDADAATLAEHELGALKGCDSGVLITLGTGLGGGLILGGRQFFGGLKRGIELGHMIIDKSSKQKCSCGNYGCAEVLCNSAYLKAEGEKHFYTGITAKQVIDLAKSDNKTAYEIFCRYAENLSCVTASIINLLDIERLVLSGGISLSGEFLLEALKRATAEKCFFEMKCEMLLSMLSDKAGVLGAALYSENHSV